MHGELTLLVNPTLEGIHAPRPLVREALASIPSHGGLSSWIGKDERSSARRTDLSRGLIARYCSRAARRKGAEVNPIVDLRTRAAQAHWRHAGHRSHLSFPRAGADLRECGV